MAPLVLVVGGLLVASVGLLVLWLACPPDKPGPRQKGGPAV